MADFSITSKINLLRPANIDSVSNFIRNKLENINVQVKSSIDRKVHSDIHQLNQSFRKTQLEVDKASDSMESFGRQTAITIRRFGAYTLVTAGFFRFVSSLNQGIREAIVFQDELVKISQVTGESLSSMKALTGEIDRLSVSLGVSSKELLDSSLVLAQAGLSAREARIALNALAKSDLAPTFDSINKTAEASIALTQQFGISINDLEKSLSSMNAVSAAFAVESADITAAIQRTGGAFSAAGGSLEELMALFTSVRSTTRESAETIATGFRTIFTRLQRTRTQSFLADLGIELREVGEEARALGREGLFVGPYKAIQRLSEALSQLDSSDPRFAQIVEELGGFRQISKVIPLVQQFAMAENALGVAMRGTNSLTEDAEKRQQSLAIQIAKVREEFQQLLRQFGDSETFKAFSQVALSLASALIKLGAALETLSPALLAVFAPRIGAASRTFAGGLLSQVTNSRILPFNKGGLIPGVGNKDSELIAAMPGEFVLKKSAVKKLGVDFVKRLNEKGEIPRFANGGLVGRVGGAATAVGLGIPMLTGFIQVDEGFKKLSSTVTTFALQLASINTVLNLSDENLHKFSTKVGELTEPIHNIKASIENRTKNFQDLSKESNKRINELRLRRDRLSSEGSPFERYRDISRERQLETKAYVSAQRSLSMLQTGDPHRYKNVDLEKIFMEKMNDLDSRKQDVDRDLQSINAVNEEIKTINEKIKKEQELINSEELRLQRLQKVQEGYQRQIVVTKQLNLAIASAAAGAVSLSSVLKRFSDTRIADIREGKTTDVGFAGVASLASGAASGTAVGMGLGMGVESILKFFNVASNMVPKLKIASVVVTGLVFGVRQATSSFREFNKEIETIKINKVSEDLGNLIKELGSGASVRTLSGEFNRLSYDLRSRMMTTTDSDLRSTTAAAIEGATDGLIDFVRKAQNASETFDQFRSIVNTQTLALVADRTGKTLSSLTKEISDSIKRQREYNAGLEESIRRNRDFEIGILSQRELDLAAQSASESLGGFSKGLEQIILGEGLNFGRGVSGAFSAIAGGAGVGVDTNRLLQFADNFGPAAERLAKQSLEAAEAIEILPSLLLKMRSSDALSDGSGSFPTRFGALLDDAGIAPAIKNALVDQVSNIIGPEGQDQSIIDQINKDFLGVFDKMVSNIVERNKNIFTSLEEASVSALRKFADGLEQSTKILDEISNIRLNIFDSREVLEGIISNSRGSIDFDALDQIQRDRLNTITGGNNDIGSLFDELRRSRSEQARLRDELSNAQSLEDRQGIISAINAEEIVVMKTTKAIEALGDAARNTAVTQKRLDKEMSDRATRRSLAIDSAFATPRERLQQGMIAHFTRQLDQTGNLMNIPTTLWGDVESFLNRLGDIKLPGMTRSGNELLDEVVRRQLGAIPEEGILKPGEAEKNLLEQIKNEFSISENIQRRLLEERERDHKTLISGLDTSFSSFIDNFRSQIDRIFEREVDTRTASISGEIDEIQRQIDIGSQLREMTNVDPQTIFDNFANISKLVQERDQNQDTLAVLLKSVDKNLISAVSNEVMAGGDATGMKMVEALISRVSEMDTNLGELLTQRLEGGDFARIISTIDQNIKFPEYSIDRMDSIFNRQTSPILDKIRESLEQGLKNSEVGLSMAGMNVGGRKNLESIISVMPQIKDLIDGLPVVLFDRLDKSLRSLQHELSIINAGRLQRNSGGYIPGFGTRDTVPAMLTEGEYVVSAPAVRKYGVGLLDSLNSGQLKGFNKGGLTRRDRRRFSQQPLANTDFSPMLKRFEEIRDRLKTQAGFPEADISNSAQRAIAAEERLRRVSELADKSSSSLNKTIDAMRASLTPTAASYSASVNNTQVERKGLSNVIIPPSRGQKVVQPPNVKMAQIASTKTDTEVKNNIPSRENTRVQQNSQLSDRDFRSFNESINKFSAAANSLSKSIASIPSEITLKATHRVEVIINGAQVLAEIQPSVVKLVEASTASAMNNFISQKFPEVGPVY